MNLAEDFISKFRQIVEKYPKHIAILTDGKHGVTYEELYKAALRLGSFLKSKNLQREDVVAVSLEKSAHYVISILGVWMAGGAFLPLPPSLPKERRIFILKEVLPKAILFDSRQENDLAVSGNLIDVRVALAFESSEYSPVKNKSDDLAYLIYTSGSTGTPKGVMVNHAGIVNLLEEQISIFKLTPASRSLFFVSVNFDASISDIGTTLLSGAVLCIETKQNIEIAADLPQILFERKITHLDIPPSLLEVLDIGRMPNTLKTIVIGGEICSVGVIKKWARRFRLVNVYGPTEATVCTSAVVCDADTWDGPDIGKPIAHIGYKIFDIRLRPVEGGKSGELFISGIGIARGYLQREKLTKEKFLSVGGEHYYRTGDLVKQVGDKIYFIGRVDRQIKIRGQLVAPEEIEITLQAIQGITRAAAIVHSVSTRRELIAFVVTSQKIDENTVREDLKKTLPAWMIPNRIIILDAMPINSNSKVDYGRLKIFLQKTKSSSYSDASLGSDHISVVMKEIWQNILEKKDIGLDDNFFALGGDSLLILQVITEAEKRGIHIPIGLLGIKSSIREIVQWYREHQGKISDGISVNDLKTDTLITAEWRRLFDISGSLSPVREKNALITGATGFLGAHLLKEILKNSKRIIYVFIRASHKESALQKIAGACSRYGVGLSDKELARIVPLCGDIAKVNLGLSKEDWGIASKEVSDIYHCAATVHMVDSYKSLRAVNVLGTKEIVKLALSGAKKRLHYASTLSVFVATDRNTGAAFENDDLSSTRVVYGGYAQSKWVAERFLQQIPKEVLDVNIFRFGLITGDSKTGRYSDHDYLKMFIRGVISLGVIPAGDHEKISVDVTPVDYAAKAMAFISSVSRAGCYHIANKKGFTLAMILGSLKRRGVNIKILNQQKWLKQVSSRKLVINEAAAFTALCRLLPSKNSFEQLRSMDLFQATGIVFDQTRARQLLRTTKIKIPEANFKLLNKYLDRIVL